MRRHGAPFGAAAALVAAAAVLAGCGGEKQGSVAPRANAICSTLTKQLASLPPAKLDIEVLASSGPAGVRARKRLRERAARMDRYVSDALDRLRALRAQGDEGYRRWLAELAATLAARARASDAQAALLRALQRGGSYDAADRRLRRANHAADVRLRRANAAARQIGLDHCVDVL